MDTVAEEADGGSCEAGALLPAVTLVARPWGAGQAGTTTRSACAQWGLGAPGRGCQTEAVSGVLGHKASTATWVTGAGLTRGQERALV